MCTDSSWGKKSVIHVSGVLLREGFHRNVKKTLKLATLTVICSYFPRREAAEQERRDYELAVRLAQVIYSLYSIFLLFLLFMLHSSLHIHCVSVCIIGLIARKY